MTVLGNLENKMNEETKQLVSESELVKSIGGSDNGVEIYQHPTQGKFAVLPEGNVTWDEDEVNTLLDNA